MECCSKLLAAYIPLAFEKNACIRKGVDIGDCLPSASKRDADVRIVYPFYLNVCVYICIDRYIISCIHIFQSWDPDWKVIGVSFRCTVCGSKVYILSQACLKPLKDHG